VAAGCPGRAAHLRMLDTDEDSGSCLKGARGASGGAALSIGVRMRYSKMVGVLLLMLALAGGIPGSGVAQIAPPDSAGDSAARWSELLQRQPFPYLIPLPEPRAAEFDGTYAMRVPSTAEHVHCLRCPDYAPEGGTWKIRFDRGVFRIIHLAGGWKSIATVIAAGDRLLLVNDPVCIDEVGIYRWKLDEGRLVLEAIDDPCAIRLRAATLTRQPWQPCRPPNVEAAVTGHWPQPEGCD
jgi:hypothetical protein